MAKLYVNTDIDILITIGSGLDIDDIVSMSITLTKAGESAGKTFAGILGGSGVTLKIPDVTGITEAGVYLVKILFTDSEGNIRGLTPTPEYLTFYA